MLHKEVHPILSYCRTWLKFYRQHFLLHFLVQKLLYLDSNFMFLKVQRWIDKKTSNWYWSRSPTPYHITRSHNAILRPRSGITLAQARSPRGQWVNPGSCRLCMWTTSPCILRDWDCFSVLTSVTVQYIVETQHLIVRLWNSPVSWTWENNEQAFMWFSWLPDCFLLYQYRVYLTLNPLRAEFIRGNKSICLHFMSR